LTLSNELADIAVVLARLDDTRKTLEADASNSPTDVEFLGALNDNLRKAGSLLQELEVLSNKLVVCSTRRKRIRWLLEKSKAAELQASLRDVRLRINELLVARNRLSLRQYQTLFQILTLPE